LNLLCAVRFDALSGAGAIEIQLLDIHRREDREPLLQYSRATPANDLGAGFEGP
jgi:hypothetical protein